MYRAHSQEWWRAGWIGDPDANRTDFINRLREEYAAFRNMSEEWGAARLRGCRAAPLRKLYADALGPCQPQEAACISYAAINMI